MAYQNLWNAGKAVTRGEFISLHVYLQKQEIYQLNNLRNYKRITEAA